MAAPNVCGRCGFANQPGYAFCTNCGGPLAAGPAPAGAPPVAPGAPGPYGVPPYGYYPPPAAFDRTKQIGRTKTGILLLLIGTLMAWVPAGIVAAFVTIVGLLLMFVGAILVILGRKAFGPTHSRNVVLSLVLFFVNIIASFAGGILITLGPIGSIGPGSTVLEIAAAFRSMATGTLLLAVLSAVISGVAAVLFTYALQNPLGRLLLWAGFAASVAVPVAVFFLVSPTIDGIVNSIAADVFSSGGDFLAVLEGVGRVATEVSLAASTYGLLGVIGAALFAAANYIAWNRINRGEIPAPVGPPGPVPPMQPTPPAPPPIQPR
ncbi:MAG: hypothetical protein A3K68_03235 [Euryarchaeota archaeon RBG_16_68_13]|nr:MAG: hypothetical protein A3K68_03235 [Euryarchaeota archaeon RBG_16_68_13]